MKSGKLTNTLLVLIFLALLAHLVAPLLAAKDATAVGRDSAAPAEIAAGAGFPALDKVASEISSGLLQIAQSNQQIASAIRENARSGERIAQSLQDVAGGVKALGSSAGAHSSRPSPSLAPSPEAEEEQEVDKDWWRGLVPE